ncbi:MAG TPA: hypothetical protein VFJ47_16745 [Terriglobales bacterium]|nr:hypothetical protein [Terriglobales bacterium]
MLAQVAAELLAGDNFVKPPLTFRFRTAAQSPTVTIFADVKQCFDEFHLFFAGIGGDGVYKRDLSYPILGRVKFRDHTIPANDVIDLIDYFLVLGPPPSPLLDRAANDPIRRLMQLYQFVSVGPSIAREPRVEIIYTCDLPLPPGVAQQIQSL